MKILLYPICLVKGHDIDVDESICETFDKTNWLCRCHRCGLYELHAGAINTSITVSRKSAREIKKEFDEAFLRARSET